MTNSQNNTDELHSSSSPIDISSSGKMLSSNDSEQDILLKEISSTNTSNNKVLSVSSKGKTRYKKIRKTKKFNFKRFKTGVIIFIIILTIIICALLIFHFIHSNKGKNKLLENNKNINVSTIDNAVSKDKGNTVIYKGDTYRYNEDLISIVLMGIDQSTLGTDVYGEAGQADAIYIFAYDTKSSKCTLIPVSRETMVDIQLYSADGNPMGYETMQLCLAYAYGDGKELSCTNTLAALSRVFYNLPLSNYIAMNWDAVEPLNEAIGGITLTSLSDVKTQYATIAKDEYITLDGKQAWSYVKYRDTSKLNSNAERLERQQHYINEFINKLIPLAEYDPTIVSKLFNAASDYMYSSMSEDELTYIASDILPNLYSSKDIYYVSIDGETVQGEEYAEFYPNDESLYEAILRVFYLKDLNFE